MKNFDIQYADGRVVTVKPISWKYLDDLTVLTQKLVVALGKVNGAVGKLLSSSNVEAWDYLKKIAAIVPVVGNKEPGIDLNQIEDMWDIVRIFITTTENTNEVGWVMAEEDQNLAPSLLAKLNSLDFYSILLSALEEMSQPQNPETQVAQ